jgi:YVTN family beta-propeller protein
MVLTACAVLLILGLGACGNDNGGSGGGGGGTTVTVTVNPPASLVQLNQSLQLSATVVGAPNLTIASSNGAVRNNNVVTITTTTNHGFAVGNIVSIQGVTDTSFLGTFAITAVPSATTFTYNQNGTNASSGNGTIPHTAVTWQVNNTTGGSAQTGTISANGLYTAPAAIPPATTATITANGAVRTGGTVTITTTAAHTFQVGQIISITGVTAPAAVTATIAAAPNGAVRTSNSVTITTTAAHNFTAGQSVTIAGVADASFNGTFTILAASSATTFTFLQTAANASSGGGTATATPPGFDGTFVIATVPNNTSLTYTHNVANATSGNGTVSSAAVQVKAISVADTTASGTSSVVLDSGISLTLNPTAATVATGDTLQFTATNSGPTATTINWLVNDIAGGNATVGTISSTGLYTAPATVPAPATVTVKAQAAADLTKTVTAQVTVSTPATPTLTALSPLTIAQGSGFQEFYLVGSNFLTTTVVRVNGVVVPVVPTAVSTTILRVRIPASFFANAGTFPVDLQAQGGATSAAINITVTPERPALIGTAPDSVAAGTSTLTAQFNGGYYSPSVVAEFNGNTRAATLVSSAQLDVPLSSGDLANAGLYAVGVRNTAAAQPLAAVNLAVQPAGTPAVVGTVNTGGPLPSAVAVNPATGIAVVANRGSGTITLIDAGTSAVVGAPIPVCGSTSSAPTGVAVDAFRNVAVVACNATDSISIVDLAAGTVLQTIASPTTAATGGAILKPVSVAVNSVNGLALVANANTNFATVIDLSTNTLLGTTQIQGTGADPEVAIDPRLNWAIITPGGSGSTSIVDLGRQTAIAATSGVSRSSNVVTVTTVGAHGLFPDEIVTIAGVADASFDGTFRVTSRPTSTTFTYDQTAANATSGGGTVRHPGQLVSFSLSSSTRGVAVNAETHRALLVDPAAANAVVLNLLDQTVTNPVNPTGSGLASAAVNPLTNVGVMGSFSANSVRLVDLGRPDTLGTAITVGSGPRAIAIDAGSNRAVVANETSGDVSIVDLGGLGTRPHIVQSTPLVTFSSGAGLTVKIVGSNLTGGTVRLDGTPVATTVVSARQLSATVPAAMLGGARRYAVDVQTGSGVSNVSELTVIQAVAVGTSPVAVAIDPERNEAIVTNSGSNSISVVDMGAGTVSATIAVGTSPQGVAVIPRLGRAVVTNFGSNNASLVDLAAGTVTGTVTTGSGPLGVAINYDTAQAVVANSTSNSVSLFPADIGGTPTVSTVEIQPAAVAIDPVRGLAAVANTTQNSVSFVNLAGGGVAGRTAVQQLPNGVVFDPESDRFLVISSLGNNLTLINPANFVGQSARLGINPTSLAYNRHSSTLVTVNAASNTMSVMDFRSRQVREVLSLQGSAGSPRQGVDIHPRTNVAVVVDQAKDRVLLIPLPR